VDGGVQPDVGGDGGGGEGGDGGRMNATLTRRPWRVAVDALVINRLIIKWT
jgi:hypothetical protein